jgi:hypothetical protein
MEVTEFKAAEKRRESKQRSRASDKEEKQMRRENKTVKSSR